jgi:AcrR family transcriptional regulator
MKTKAQLTRQRILDAALKVFARKGFHETRMNEIVEEAQSSKGGVYFHFTGKEQIFLALIDEFARLLEGRLVESIAAEPRGIRRVEAALEAGLSVFGEYNQLAKIFLLQAVGLGQAFESKRLEILDRFAGLIQQHLDDAISDGNIAPIDTQIVAYAWVGSINELVMRWIQTGQPEPDRILPTLQVILMRSIGFDGEYPE